MPPKKAVVAKKTKVAPEPPKANKKATKIADKQVTRGRQAAAAVKFYILSN
jgi:hypothetical protein